MLSLKQIFRFHFINLLIRRSFAGLCFLLLATQPLYAQDEVKIGILAFRPVSQTEAQWSPLSAALEKAYPEYHFIIKAYSFDELKAAVAGRQIDFIFTNPAHYVLLKYRFGLAPPIATLENMEQGKVVSRFGGVMFARAARSDIQTLEDLRGKVIAATGIDSLGGYQTQAYELSRAGLSIPKDIHLALTGMPHDNVVNVVLAGKADVGFVRSGVLETMAQEGKLDLASIRIINHKNQPDFPVQLSTRLYPEWLFASLPNTDRELNRKVASFLLNIAENKSLTKSLQIHGFDVPADNAPVEKVLQELHIPPFEEGPEFTLFDIWDRFRGFIWAGLLTSGLILVLGLRLWLSNRHLINSELRYRTVADYTHDWEYWLGPDNQIFFMSPSCERFTGYTVDEFVANPSLIYQIIFPEDQPLMDGHLEMANQLRGVETFTFRIVRRDGDIRWIEHTCQPVQDNKGSYNGRRVANRDVTDQKLAETRYADSESRLRTIIDSEPECIKIVDAKGTLKEMNRAGLAMLEADSIEQVAGNPVINVIAPEYRRAFIEMHKRVIAGESLTLEFDVIGLHGGRRRLETHAVPMIESSGETVHLAVTRDITERKHAEDVQRQASEYARSLIEASLDPLVTISADGKVMDVNQATERITGCSRDELIGSDFSDYFTEPDKARKGYQQVFANGFVTDYSLAIRHKSGSVTEVLYNASVYRNEEGEVQGVFAAARDVTEQRKAQQAIQKAKEMAEHMANVRAEFLANMSHEIRTPMNAIIGLSHLALNRQVSDDVRDYLEKINNSSESLLGILNDILDFSKIEAGKLQIENHRFNLDNVLGNLSNLFSHRAEEKHLAFGIEVAEDVPTDLFGDALRLQQILSNLLGNALKFTERGNVAVKIKLLDAEKSQVRLHFSVCDTGIGLSQKDQAKLFQPFSQVDTSATRRFGGTGLGLAISRNLLNLMGSDLQVESTPGKGSTFTFDLLLTAASNDLHHAVDRRHEKRQAGALSQNLRERGKALSGAKVLVVEDNFVNQ